MNELFDKLIIRVFFTFFICVIIYLYKHAHRFLYPSSRSQMFKRFYPAKNAPDTIHLFARIIGIAIIFSQLGFQMSDGILLSLSDFFIQATCASSIYLLSIYILESIVLYNFEYADEIIKRKNFAYALISFSHMIGIAFIIKTCLNVANGNQLSLLFIWLFSIVLIGFATKSFSYFSQFSFNRSLIQKKISVAISYMGLFWGWVLIISTSLDHNLSDIKNYAIQVILKILLAIIIFPIFKKFLILIFQLQENEYSIKNEDGMKGQEETLGIGIFEGVLFLTSAFLTSIITEQISFGSFYPIL